MNCPSRTDEQLERTGWNQNPPSLAADLTTREDLNGITNLRTRRNSNIAAHAISQSDGLENDPQPEITELDDATSRKTDVHDGYCRRKLSSTKNGLSYYTAISAKCLQSKRHIPAVLEAGGRALKRYSKFIGPGFMVAVAYIDPGNYSTDVAAGAALRFKLLFIILLSNIFAILLQSLAIRLGTVTGMNLAENCRANLPRWLNICLYLLAEGAIIATDIAEVCFPSFGAQSSVLRLLLGYWLCHSAQSPP